MNLHKTVVVLLALLLAGMAMVPMVNAAENANTASVVDVSKIPLPQLQLNSSQTNTRITTALSPVAGSDVYHIPTGSIIHHSKIGLTHIIQKKN